jgi:hypothetical protein
MVVEGDATTVVVRVIPIKHRTIPREFVLGKEFVVSLAWRKCELFAH